MLDKPKISISINPTYFCNFDCSFCYLSTDQLNNSKKIDIEILKQKINQVEEVFQIKTVDLYGGEVGLLSDEYLMDIYKIFSQKDVHFNVITNLSIINNFFYHPGVDISVSWDGPIRRRYNHVLKNIAKLGKPVHLLMLVSKDMINWSNKEFDTVVEQINIVPNIVSVELKPYSTNQANQDIVTYLEYEKFVKKWFEVERNFLFINEQRLKDVFRGTQNSFSDDHIYINPYGKFCVLDFDENDNEFFLEVNSIEEYIDWANHEKLFASNNLICSKCEFLGNCLTEHMRVVTSKKNSCNGYYHLINWYKDNCFERTQN